MAMQIIQNTFEEASIPSTALSELQDDLNCTNININNIILTNNMQGVRINTNSYNINISNINSNDCCGNQLIIENSSSLVGNINVGNVNIKYHHQGEDATFNSSIPIFINGVNRCNIVNINIDGTRAFRPVFLNVCSYVNIKSLNINDARNELNITSCSNINIDSVIFTNHKTSYNVIQIGGSSNNININNINGVFGTGIITSRAIQIRDTASNIKMKNGSIQGNALRGISLESTGNGFYVEDIEVNGFTDAISFSNSTDISVINARVRNCYNGIILASTCSGKIRVINSIIPSTRGIVDNTTTTTKLISNNLAY